MSPSLPAPASAPAPSPSTSAAPAPVDGEELEKLLNREATALQRELEVERILKAFKLNPYHILDVEDTIPQEDVKKRFRQLSLFIHPDKCPHARAPEAFDLLKKAEADISDLAKRADLDAIIAIARADLLKSHGLPASTPPTDPAVKKLMPDWTQQLRDKAKHLLIDEELRRRKAIKMNLANEGLEAKKKEDEEAQRKRKVEEDKLWEANREQRVDSWRSFASSGKKKRKTKVNVLG